MLRELKAVPGVKRVFVRSGIRFDYLLADRDRSFFRELVRDHVSGQLRVAPEHVADRVLDCMGKPRHSVYQEFLREFQKITKQCGKEQYAVPYFISSHPGCGISEAVELAEYVRDMGFTPEQVQDFYPTPATVSTCMYYTGLNPLTMEEVYVPRTYREKAMQRALLQYDRPENYDLVREALVRAGRQDLIGFGEKCLIPPRKIDRKRGNISNRDGKSGKAWKNVSERKGKTDRKRRGR